MLELLVLLLVAWRLSGSLGVSVASTASDSGAGVDASVGVGVDALPDHQFM